MKVLLVSSLQRGGPLEQTLVLAAGLVERSVAVCALCANDAVAERFFRAGAEAEVLPQRRGLDALAAIRIWRRMRTFDVVHAQDRRSGLWVRLAPAMRLVARVYTAHGLPDPYLPPPIGHDRPSLRDRLAYEGIDAVLCRRADAVVIPSAALAMTFRERLGFPDDRIRVVPNGVDIRRAVARSGQEIGTLSLLEPVKDVRTFLDAAGMLVQSHPGLRFVVFGDGSERTALLRHASRLGIDDRVDFPGYVERDVALTRLAVLVLPSIFENAPMVLLEAMAAEIPVVASRTGGIPEITGEDTALLVEPGDGAGFAAAIARLLDDRPLAHARARAGSARVTERFTSDINVDSMLRVYQKAIEGRRQ